MREWPLAMTRRLGAGVIRRSSNRAVDFLATLAGGGAANEVMLGYWVVSLMLVGLVGASLWSVPR